MATWKNSLLFLFSLSTFMIYAASSLQPSITDHINHSRYKIEVPLSFIYINPTKKSQEDSRRNQLS
jgi:hypothetical protein